MSGRWGPTQRETGWKFFHVTDAAAYFDATTAQYSALAIGQNLNRRLSEVRYAKTLLPAPQPCDKGIIMVHTNAPYHHPWGGVGAPTTACSATLLDVLTHLINTRFHSLCIHLDVTTELRDRGFLLRIVNIGLRRCQRCRTAVIHMLRRSFRPDLPRDLKCYLARHIWDTRYDPQWDPENLGDNDGDDGSKRMKVE